MTTHITDARQAVTYYMQSVPSEAVRLRSLFDTYGNWTKAARHVKGSLGAPYQFGGARDGQHTATVERISEELRRRAEEHGVALPLDAFLQRPEVRELLDEYNAIIREDREDHDRSQELKKSLAHTAAPALHSPAPSVASGVIPKFEARSDERNTRLNELAEQINALARKCGRDPYIVHGGGPDE